MPRPRILIAWEMGGNFGHAAMVAGLARDLADADLTVAARDPDLMRRLIGDAARIVTAPRPPDDVLPGGEEALNYPDVLRQTGWAEPEGLAARIRAWSTLIENADPDVIAAEAAPTALLAARGRGAPTAIFGTGWSVPPRAAPTPAFLHWGRRRNGGA